MSATAGRDALRYRLVEAINRQMGFGEITPAGADAVMAALDGLPDIPTDEGRECRHCGVPIVPSERGKWRSVLTGATGCEVADFSQPWTDHEPAPAARPETDESLRREVERLCETGGNATGCIPIADLRAALAAPNRAGTERIQSRSNND